MGGAVLPLQGEQQPGVIGIEFIVQHVHHPVSVDLHQGLSGADTRPVGRGPGLHPLDLGTQGHASLIVLISKVYQFILSENAAKVKSPPQIADRLVTQVISTYFAASAFLL